MNEKEVNTQALREEKNHFITQLSCIVLIYRPVRELKKEVPFAAGLGHPPHGADHKMASGPCVGAEPWVVWVSGPKLGPSQSYLLRRGSARIPIPSCELY